MKGESLTSGFTPCIKLTDMFNTHYLTAHHVPGIGLAGDVVGALKMCSPENGNLAGLVLVRPCPTVKDRCSLSFFSCPAHPGPDNLSGQHFADLQCGRGTM